MIDQLTGEGNTGYTSAMKGTATEKLLAAHLVEGETGPGREIGLRIDQTLTQDATGTMVYLEYESLGLGKVRTELSVSYVDHNIIQTDFKNADDHRFLQSSASKYGVVLSPPGNGVSHHVHRQRFGAPGKTLLGSDSHTTTGGCLGMLAMGAGGLEIAMAMAGRPYFITTPKVWGIRVDGSLPRLGVGQGPHPRAAAPVHLQGRRGKGAGVLRPRGGRSLDMSARGTIANMSVDMGATATVFPSDEVTRRYLAMNGREPDWRAIAAESDARYDEVTEIDLASPSCRSWPVPPIPTT